MKILYPRLLITAFTLTMLIHRQECLPVRSLPLGGSGRGNKQITYNDHDFQIYKLLSSINEDSQFWLPTDVIRLVVGNMHIISTFLSSLKINNCSNQNDLLSTTDKLNRLYHTDSSMPAVLLKIHLNTNKVSLLKIRGWDFGSFVPPTIFDCFGCDDFYNPIFKTWCQTVDKKVFVDRFKQCENKYGHKENRLHNFITCDFRVEIMKSFFCVFLDYAKNCPEKSKEVLDVIKAKDGQGKTALDLAREKGKVEIVTLIESTIKELKCNMQKKEHCLIQ